MKAEKCTTLIHESSAFQLFIFHIYVKLACNRVLSPGIAHIACESVEMAIQTFMFGCLFSIFHHAIKNVSLIVNTDQTFSL